MSQGESDTLVAVTRVPPEEEAAAEPSLTAEPLPPPAS
jgi:hypothetical protein